MIPAGDPAPFVAIGYFLAVLVAASTLLLVAARRRRAERRARWGRPIERVRDLDAIRAYHDAVADPAHALDAQTWRDLDLDRVFALLDRTESGIGQQVLYDRLRGGPRDAAELSAFDAAAARLARDVALRERLQDRLAALSGAGALDLYGLALDAPPPRRWWEWAYPALSASVLVVAPLALVRPTLAPLLLVPPIVGIVVRATVLTRLLPLLASLGQLRPLLRAARAIVEAGRGGTAAPAPELAPWSAVVREALPRLRGVRLLARWAGRNASGADDLRAVVLEYVNLFLLLDATALVLGGRALKRAAAPLHAVLRAVGTVDAALAVASWRTELDATGTPWTVPAWRADDAPLALDGMRHPLVADCVPNDVALAAEGPGILLTGANASGKSTYVRALGVTVMLAQTVATACAARHAGPMLAVRSCIARGDDLGASTSYYQAEVRAVLAMLDASARGERPALLLFDELFRGTNTVERIAIAEAVLRYLARGDGANGTAAAGVAANGIVPGARPRVVAATHDTELVALLAGAYAPFHFRERVEPAGLTFDYVRRPGVAPTRNAIALLAAGGAPRAVVDGALARVALLERETAS